MPTAVPEFAAWLPAAAPEDSRLAVRALAVPDAPALRQRRGGRWLEWRWRDAADEVTRLAAGLAAIGFRPGDRLWVCGAFEPALLCLALAAGRAGGVVEAVSGRHPRLTLARPCAVPPAVVYVRDRAAAATWLDAADAVGVATTLVFDDAVPLDGEGLVGARSLPIAHLRALADAPAPSAARPARRGSAGRLTWVEEGTGWRGGLEAILDAWLTEGFTLAFPEGRRGAERDRRSARPDAMLVSPTRLNAIAAAATDQLRRRGPILRLLARLAADDGCRVRGGQRGLAAAGLRRALGLGRLRSVQVGPDRAAEPLHAVTRSLFESLDVDLQIAVGAAPPPAPVRRERPAEQVEEHDTPHRDPAWSFMANGWT